MYDTKTWKLLSKHWNFALDILFFLSRYWVEIKNATFGFIFIRSNFINLFVDSLECKLFVFWIISSMKHTFSKRFIFLRMGRVYYNLLMFLCVYLKFLFFIYLSTIPMYYELVTWIFVNFYDFIISVDKDNESKVTFKSFFMNFYLGLFPFNKEPACVSYCYYNLKLKIKKKRETVTVINNNNMTHSAVIAIW